MATDRETVQQILDQLSMPEDVRVRAMMGEYVLYFRERVVGGIYDGRLLIKKTPTAANVLPAASSVVPYPGAKEMLWVEDPAQHALLLALFEAMLPEIPPARKKRRHTDVSRRND